MKYTKILTLAVSTSLLMVLFQNCSPTSQTVKFSENEKSILASDGNGHGYDGKIFLVNGDLCPDNSIIHSKIVLKSATTGNLVRENCQDIAPLAIGPSEFSVSTADQLIYKSRLFVSQIPTGAVVLEASKFMVSQYGGFSYLIHSPDFGGAADISSSLIRSQLRLFENGVEVGPAHSVHATIASTGLGRFSHWSDEIQQSIYFSATDNSSPITNGRIYSYKFGP